mmetsp:Transcript_11549/g.25318  ORF Transcript_11549/g.25318 Transcript_11549/m.25318 type:complete len:1715 (-) Transcript_11549:74-5218(-)|eukprot:CAMPEP_0172312984 /NCGR_PEP_ID=MMETSP1058-20130122/19011_1 /TAXON_ID=83371 /ORGANISM="Detonula confervacea, Strain CCMP 353" /LENGTH=1714 /DNA_ID=CAMNT_0013026553 /DNA_START=106 /DNA_END=5250 /DNA_ORIENTATION=+
MASNDDGADEPPRPIPRNALPCDSENISHVELFRPKTITNGNANATNTTTSTTNTGGKKKKRRTPLKKYHLLFATLYLYQLHWIYSTIGLPYKQFLDKAEREGFEVMEGSAKMRAELTHALSDIDDANRLTKKMGWFDWMEMDIEEQASRKKREKELTVLDSLPKSMRVPKRYAASFSSCLCSGILATLHLLVVLLQVWSVKFNVWMNYVGVDGESVEVPEEWMELDEDANPLLRPIPKSEAAKGSADSGTGGKGEDTCDKKLMERIEYNNGTLSIPKHLPTHAVITPSKPTESRILVPLLYMPTLGVTMEYHRRRYYLDQSSGDTPEWIKIRCNTTMPLGFFSKWTGISSSRQQEASSIRFGLNLFEVRQPTFVKMYKAQLLSPFTVFQLFCVILWMLDDYWQYSAFTLFMILTFEATVVFSRLKSLGALRGMGNKARKMMVYREGRWGKVWTSELLPGDILSLTRCVAPKKKKDDAAADGDVANGNKVVKTKAVDYFEDGDVVPADVLLLRGSTVVNEASLTGESVPQMKEGMSELVEGEFLDMKTRHKNHVLYAGTKMLQCKGVEILEEEEASSDEDAKVDEEGEDESAAATVASPKHHVYGDIPNPPDGGCLTFVLRTGFSSAQGKLVRMIEGSQEKVKGHERETALLLLLLFNFAVASSGYVLYHGLQNDERSQYELLLHCILIITSVIPPELPMQMALAVNNSLMTLMKLQIFCTEPYRVPMAGKLDCCLFDKTGTLTTDELVPVGVLGGKSLGLDLGALVSSSAAAGTTATATAHASAKKSGEKKGGKEDTAESQLLTPMTKLSHEAALVLTGCHSLVLIEGETTGDPLESAALKAMRWEVSSKSGRVVPSAATEKKAAGAPFSMPDNSSGSPSTEIEILSRHHFSSKLQRMSCVVKDVANRKFYSVVKGSPEMVGTLLKTKPTGYDKAARFLSRRGYRVISLAYKPLSNGNEVDSAKDTRSICESNLTFAGFVAFTCRVRRDTKMVLSKLKEGGMSVAMVTGDALLTAIHVAKEVNICDSEDANVSGGSGGGAANNLFGETNKELQELLESKRAQNAIKTAPAKKRKSEVKPILILEQDTNDGHSMYWQSYDDDSAVEAYVASAVPELVKKYDLATTGTNLAAAYEYDPITKSILEHFKVFARMTPDAKETVIECLHSVGKLCLMCGDGANDVGALKQADVGVALLSGFGDVNVDKGEDGNKKKQGAAGASGSGVVANTNSSTNITVISPRDMQAARLGPVWALKAKLVALGVDLSKYPELTEKEDLIKLWEIKGRETAIKKREQQRRVEEVKKKRSEGKEKQRGAVQDKQRKMALRVQELEAEGVQWAQFKALQEFMAAEKTEGKKKKAEMVSKHSVAGSAATIAGQLEDLEMDELPMVKIGDASVAAPFTSKMPSIRSCVDIVRQGRCTLVTSIQMYQILALNCLISAYSLSVLYLDGVKYGDTQMTAMGMLGSISYMSVSRAKPLEKLSSVKPLTSIFHPSLFISLLGQFSVHLVTMMWATNTAKQYLENDHKVDLDGEFKPGILNSVVFLVSNVQQVTVFVVNLQGRPFMTGLTENRPLLWSLLATFILTFMFASESVPGLNKYFQLVPFPDEDFRNFIIKILVGDVAICFLFDRAMKLLFCPQILKASVEGTTMKDVMKLARTVTIIGILMNMFLGNSEQWEEMLEEEARLAEEALLNSTDAVSGESIVAAVEDAFQSGEF